MPETRLITADTVRNYTALASTLNDNFINPGINEAQTAFIRPLLGDTLYTTLLSETASSSLTTENQALVTAMTPYLAYRSIQTYFYSDGLYSTPTGFRQLNEENSSAISNERRTGLLRHYENMAEAELQQVRAFLNENKADYPTWDNDCQNYEAKPKFSISGVKRDSRRNRKVLGDGKTYRNE